MTELKVKRLTEDAILPSYAHQGDAGMDLYSITDIVIEPGMVALIPTGISIEVPESMEAQIRPRSGLALKKSITVLNTPGTIDSGYRGQVSVILINHGKNDVEIKKGERIAQMIISRFETVTVKEIKELSSSERGTGGFGSTGN